LELADIVRRYRPAYQAVHPLTLNERAVLDAVKRCRTSELGGHLDVCLECGHERPSYNSCHNRHCPKCPAVAQARWIAGRLERVLPTHYFHVVFTLPAELRAVARGKPMLLYDLLFRCAAETLLELGRDTNRLGGELGVTTVLHTWSRDLSYHPHVHCVVTGGALSVDGERWLSAGDDYLFPVEVMGKLFRGKLLDALRRARKRGALQTNDPTGFAAIMARLYRKDWVVYCKRPFGGPEQVVRYLGQYTHRIAISNHRLVSMDEHGVTFRTKNGKRVTVDGVAFLERWLSHVLPPGFVKIRHHGLVSAAHATTRLEVARQRLLATASTAGSQPSACPSSTPAPNSVASSEWRDIIELLTGIDLGACPRCRSRSLRREPLPRWPHGARAPPKAA
jgi:hypothetical protein